jgi:hypothetical protein
VPLRLDYAGPINKPRSSTPLYVRVIGLTMSVLSLSCGLLLGWASADGWVGQLSRNKTWDLPEFAPFFAVTGILVVAGVVGIRVVYTSTSDGKQGR